MPMTPFLDEVRARVLTTAQLREDSADVTNAGLCPLDQRRYAINKTDVDDSCLPPETFPVETQTRILREEKSQSDGSLVRLIASGTSPSIPFMMPVFGTA